MPSRAPHQVVLRRRGVLHGRFDPLAPARAGEAARRELWRRNRPIFLPGILRAALRGRAAELRRSLALFEAVRAGALDFQAEVRRRLRARRELSPSGATVDAGDAREIEKVWVDGMRGRRFVARALYAKLSWIAHDERDRSLRIRFSFGSEDRRDWLKETCRAPWASRFAEALFPECAVLAQNAELLRAIERLLGRRARLSERIVYSNAPGGGAVFHHDCEPRQLGVVFGQLRGETAWLALPKRELARHVADLARTPALRRLAGTPARALRALDGEDERLRALLDSTPALTRRLAAHGALLHLRAGEALLLPNHGWNDAPMKLRSSLPRRNGQESLTPSTNGHRVAHRANAGFINDAVNPVFLVATRKHLGEVRPINRHNLVFRQTVAERLGSMGNGWKRHALWSVLVPVDGLAVRNDLADIAP